MATVDGNRNGGEFGWRTCSLRHWQLFFWLKKIRPWWGICLIIYPILERSYWFFENNFASCFLVSHNFSKWRTSRVCRVFRGECEIVHMTQQRHPVAGALKQTVWNGGTPQQIIPSVFGAKVRCFTISQLETPNQMQKISWCALPDPIDSCVSFPQDLQRCLSIWGAPGRGERENVENPLERNLKV